MEAFSCIGLRVGGTESAGGGSQLTDPAPLPSRNKGDKKNITGMHLIKPRGRVVEPGVEEHTEGAILVFQHQGARHSP